MQYRKCHQLLTHNSDIQIGGYYGTYNGAIVVMLDGIEATEAEWSETIAGIDFYYHNGNYLRVYLEQESSITVDTIPFKVVESKPFDGDYVTMFSHSNDSSTFDVRV